MKSSAPTEIDLLHRIAECDEDAFLHLYDLHSSRVYSLIHHIVEDSPAVLNILLASFRGVWNEAKGFNPNLHDPVAWIARVSRDLAVAHSGGNGDRGLPVPSKSPLPLLVEHSTLTPDQSILLSFPYFKGYNRQTIAGMLQSEMQEVKARLCDAVLTIRSEALGVTKAWVMYSRYLEELAMLNAVCALEGEEVHDFARLASNVVPEEQAVIASYELAAFQFFDRRIEKLPAPALVRGRLLEHIQARASQ